MFNNALGTRDILLWAECEGGGGFFVGVLC